ncbi:hypothetical protein [Marinobacterium lacunae]|uniref:hypothetical protein n=1 Tax=Marinobacterium lacunae TaxID=1232683 RepID=UPI00056D00F8|nr:hypothetical protein [Marinobacterium lacunae]
MSVPANKREEAIRGLFLRPEVTELLLKHAEFGALSRYFELPHYFYSKGSPEGPGEWPELVDRELLPLWEFSGEIYAVDLLSNKLLAFNIEYPTEYELLDSIDQAIFKMIELHTWEFGGEEQEIEEAIEFAERVKLPNISGLTKLFAQYMECTEEMITEYRQTL